MKKLLISTAMLVIPFMAAADELTEDRIKELVLEAIRENPGIVFEAAQLFEEQQVTKSVSMNLSFSNR